MCCRSLLFLMVCVCANAAAYGDLSGYTIRTTEWLVEHSDRIVVAEFVDDKSDSILKVLTEIKGTAASIEWSRIKPSTLRLYPSPFYGPPTGGTVRMLFIRGNDELLEAVEMGRAQGGTGPPSLVAVLYGVNQFGELHLTQHSLMNAVRAQMVAQPSPLIKPRKNFVANNGGVSAPKSFPLENSEETFVLLVDFTERRRDYYLAKLAIGNCGERTEAIYALAAFADSVSLAAIEAAAKTSNCDQSYAFQLADRRTHVEKDQTIRNAANHVLNIIKRNQSE